MDLGNKGAPADADHQKGDDHNAKDGRNKETDKMLMSYRNDDVEPDDDGKKIVQKSSDTKERIKLPIVKMKNGGR